MVIIVARYIHKINKKFLCFMVIILALLTVNTKLLGYKLF